MNRYRITEGTDISLNDIIVQLKAIKELPCILRIYDRIVTISDKEEMWALISGFEIGWYMAEQFDEDNKARCKLKQSL